MTGILMVIIGIILFITHASGMVKTLSAINIWLVSLLPSGIWLFILCLRGWRWGKEVDEHDFLKKEAEYAQKQWEAWAGRYLAINDSCIFLPDKITVGCLHNELPQQYGLVRKINYLPESKPLAEEVLLILLKGVTDTLYQLPAELPVKVTLATDLPDIGLSDSFSAVWLPLLAHSWLACMD
ncbi:hypothetical protein MXM41_03055 [Leclercia adecarboxylata]|uniref:hypothetical protein n=1 Tax=Leclercia adecarboxylata TaxID=83655 RepID=UPI002DB686FD|nr:hypothetical protein [Leclercia adecarboxylata]MEB6377926.1 hypothetical protein [Leclercia adecarboxylata]